MTFRALIVGCLAMMSIEADAASSAEQGDVLRSVLAYHAGDIRLPHRLGAGREICVVPDLSDPPFESRLDAIRREVRAEVAQNTDPAARIVDDVKLDELVRHRLWQGDGNTDTATIKRIVDAAYALAARPASGARDKVDRGWLSGGERLDGGESCREVLTLSQPAIEGDLAFVDVTHNCGALCGLQATLLLRKHGPANWRVEDGDIHLIS